MRLTWWLCNIICLLLKHSQNTSTSKYRNDFRAHQEVKYTTTMAQKAAEKVDRSRARWNEIVEIWDFAEEKRNFWIALKTLGWNHIVHSSGFLMMISEEAKSEIVFSFHDSSSYFTILPYSFCTISLSHIITTVRLLESSPFPSSQHHNNANSLKS